MSRKKILFWCFIVVVIFFTAPTLGYLLGNFFVVMFAVIGIITVVSVWKLCKTYIKL